jgi:hypothetical protein
MLTRQEIMTIQQAAAQLVTLGYRVVPLQPGTKQPAAGVGWQQRALRTVADTVELSDCNIGVLGGSPICDGHRLLVVDIDGKKEPSGFDSLRRLENDYQPLPVTVAVTSPNKGRHLYYLVPEDAPLSGISKLLHKLGYAGIDLIGQGLYVVAPPSVLPTGSYCWERRPDEGLSFAPRWLLHLLRLAGRHGPLQCKEKPRKGLVGRTACRHAQPGLAGLVEEVIHRYPITAPGQRHDQMHPAVLRLLRKRLSPEHVQQVMLRWLEHFAGEFTTPFEEAVTLLDDCIANTIRNIEAGKVSIEETDHLATQAALTLTPQQVAFIHQLPLLSSPFPCSLPLPHGKGGLDGDTTKPSRLTRRERQFAEVLLILAIYERSKAYRKAETGDDFLATNHQMIDLLKTRFGVDMAPTNGNEGAGKHQLRRLKKAFVTMTGRPAEKAELMVLKRVGIRGTPSVYTLTGLLGAFTEDSN